MGGSSDEADHWLLPSSFDPRPRGALLLQLYTAFFVVLILPVLFDLHMYTLSKIEEDICDLMGRVTHLDTPDVWTGVFCLRGHS